MSRDAHFLQRLDRVSRDHLELALGLYRDRELVQYILTHARAAEGRGRVALALADDGDGPYVLVERDGAFVTCLGKGMRTELPVVSRAHVEGLAAKVERVREGLDLAKKRGLDQARGLDRIERFGSAVSREDFVAASAVLEPARPLVMGVYGSCVQDIAFWFPIAHSPRGREAATVRDAHRYIGQAAWGLAHAATLVADAASREWVEEWSKLEVHRDRSLWAPLSTLCGLPFVVRAAWVGARLGKPFLLPQKARFIGTADPLQVAEDGWSLLCMAMRHDGLRTEVLKALRAQHDRVDPGEAILPGHATFAALAKMVDEDEPALRAVAMSVGRSLAVKLLESAPEGSAHRYRDESEVPDEVAMPALLTATDDAYSGPQKELATLLAVVAASRAQGADFYFPASALRAMHRPDVEAEGKLLVGMRRALIGKSEPVRIGPRPGRNDPCDCGSGKKYKKCHGR